MNEAIGVLMAVLSSCLGGFAGAVTRFLVGRADPVTLAILRWVIVFFCILPVALALRVRWPARRDVPFVIALGLVFFGLFFVLYNLALGYTTAARASLALSTLPVQTMVVGAVLGIEKLTARARQPVSRSRWWACSPRLQRVFNRPGRRVARRVDHGGRGAMHGALHRLEPPLRRTLQFARFSHHGHGGGCRGVGGVGRRHRSDPDVGDVRASLLAAVLVNEPVTPNLVVGLVAVFAGIWIGTTDPRMAVV